MSFKNGPIRILFRLYDEGYLSCAVGDHIARMYHSGLLTEDIVVYAQCCYVSAIVVLVHGWRANVSAGKTTSLNL